MFSKLSFSLNSGELLHVRGSNGSGKTSLLRIICGLFTPAEGEVKWNSKNIRELREEYFHELTYLGHLNGIKDELSGIENLGVLSKLAGLDISEDEILDALYRLGLRGREDLPTKFLSQGQKRRVALSRLLLSKTSLWVLDEPFTALDVAAVDLLKSLISEHLEKGGMVILTTHQDVEIKAGSARHISLDS